MFRLSPLNRLLYPIQPLEYTAFFSVAFDEHRGNNLELKADVICYETPEETKARLQAARTAKLEAAVKVLTTDNTEKGERIKQQDKAIEELKAANHGLTTRLDNLERGSVPLQQAPAVVMDPPLAKEAEDKEEEAAPDETEFPKQEKEGRPRPH